MPAGVNSFEWFKDNNLKINPDKRHLLITTNNTVMININSFDTKKQHGDVVT